jgi:hypothetical protein
MNPVRSVKNQYVGVNAHLQSLLQQGGWGGFHTAHITYLAGALQIHLRHMGYTAEIEDSLQIRRIGEAGSRPQSDILIYDSNPIAQFVPTEQTAIEFIPLMTLLEEDLSENPFRAVVIYEVDERNRKKGAPVAWIELLSPSNKGNTPDAGTFIRKRMELLESGIVFIEIDYLHETPPTFKTISQDIPYRIVVMDPRPEFHDGLALPGLFFADSPIPRLRIPLNNGDALDFDFGVPYQKHFSEVFYGDQIDYTEYPVNFDRYTPADQARIANRMLAVLEAAHNGLDLESAPFPTANLTLDEARAQIEELKR